MGYQCVHAVVCMVSKWARLLLPTRGTPSRIPSDQGTHLTGRSYKTWWRLCKPPGIITIMLTLNQQAQLRELLGFSILKSLNLLNLQESLPPALLTIHSIPFRKDKLTPREVDQCTPLHFLLIVCCPVLVWPGALNLSCIMLKAYHQKVKKALLDSNSKNPVGHSLEPRDWVF